MSINTAMNPQKSTVSFQAGGPKDVLKGLNESFRRSSANRRETVPSQLYQPCVFFTRTIKRFFRKPLLITLPFYSDSIFLREEDALRFIPYFIKRLIEKGLIDPTCIKADGMIDESMIETGLARLTLAFAERNDI